MPLETKWETHGFYARFWGTVTLADIETKNRTFSNSPLSDHCHYQIFDGSEIESFDLPANGIVEMASHDIGMGSYLRGLSVIHIASRPEVREVYQKYISLCLRLNLSWKFHICNNLEQARSWLSQQEKRRAEEAKQKTPPPFFFHPTP
ncbi:hypothetical protein [Pelagicoccus sp. SDUM812005]|uniref:hypothetical protein n=1 Tax=Pelagicoccus sp. SDUM812005 TaxID=3041257 RepID=UPI00280D7D6D|nr:hypothetical protein [Pelagicoccus sp. SDUM812005]MDQ8181979.1 hypothetical protein [Pelagicoccus sp. SDUM812005]